MSRLTFGLMLAGAVLVTAGAPDSGAAATITIENRSSIPMRPDDPLTVTIDETSLGRELLVSGSASERTAAGERLVGAMLKFVMTRADGTTLLSGNDTAQVAPGERVKCAGSCTRSAPAGRCGAPGRSPVTSFCGSRPEVPRRSPLF